MKFPQYDYDDMVRSQHTMLVEGLHVDHLRLILGTSMGCMQSFVWGETYPELHGRARALRLPARRARRPQPHVALHGHAGHPRRSRLEERQLHRRSRSKACAAPPTSSSWPAPRRCRCRRTSPPAQQAEDYVDRHTSIPSSPTPTPTTSSTTSTPRATTTPRRSSPPSSPPSSGSTPPTTSSTRRN